jgi:hypothetical protein
MPQCRALEYSVTSEYRWSKKYKLLKRGYTIDTWDFQSERRPRVRWRHHACASEKDAFRVMFGDNTATLQACRQVAEMLEHLSRRQRSGALIENAPVKWSSALTS